MNPDKRGNPPFEPSSYAAGLERRMKRHNQWATLAVEMTKRLLDGSPAEKAAAEQWWRDHLNQPKVEAS
jgi:hypothetical protein